MRLSTEFWVSAYMRQSQLAGDFTALMRKGAERGGSIFIIINRLDGSADLYVPAPQSMLGENSDERIFTLAMEAASEEDVTLRIEKETRFDSDLWVIERESRNAQHDLIIVDSARS